MDATRMHQLAEGLLEAWNSQDVDRVLARYTDDVVYRDPNTRGEVKGAEALGRYLRALFGAWTMTWRLKEARLFEDGGGCAALWRASLRRAGGGPAVELEGMDLVIVAGDRVARNEVYFDRSALASLR